MEVYKIVLKKVGSKSLSQNFVSLKFDLIVVFMHYKQMKG